MGESRVGLLERPRLQYEPTLKERQLVGNETSRLQKIQGSPRIWYVDVAGVGAGIFKSRNYKGQVISDTQNERAAYLISHLGGFDFVPTTVLRRVDGQEGALQEYVPHAKLLHEVTRTREIDEGLYKYWIFGHAIRNMDRHDDNLLVKDGRIISIDHEGSFDPDYSDPAYFDDFRQYYGQPAPQNLVESLGMFRSDRMRQEILKESLREIITAEDVDVTMERIDEISKILLKNGGIARKEELAII